MDPHLSSYLSYYRSVPVCVQFLACVGAWMLEHSAAKCTGHVLCAPALQGGHEDCNPDFGGGGMESG